MPSVKLGPKFFKKERDGLYNNWVTAFSREMFQNSIDAGSSRIDIKIESINGKECLVEFRDNGCGMSFDTLENVYFALAESTKNDGSTLGGFGRARVLTCFAQKAYEIFTGKYHVVGSGADYEINTTNDFVKGCTFKIIIEDKSPDELIDSMKNVLSKSQMDCDVYLNGIRWTSWMYRRHAIRSLDCGNIHVNKSQYSNGKIIVRVKGLWTFDLYTSCSYQVIVEIDTENSRNILTANRDSFHYRYQCQLEQWLQEVAVDKKSALRETRRYTKLVECGGTLVMRNKKLTQNMVLKKVDSGDTSEFEPRAKIPAQQFRAASMINGSVNVVENRKTDLTDIPSVYIDDDTSNDKIRKVIPNYNPENWGESVKVVRGIEQRYNKGSNYKKLLIAWKVACEHALEALIEYSENVEISWLIGWTFSDSCAASHEKVSNCHALCLNPVSSDGTMKYAVRCREDLFRLMALAKHEAAHVCIDCHNEDFSTIHTEIDSRFDTTRTLRAIKDALSQFNM